MKKEKIVKIINWILLSIFLMIGILVIFSLFPIPGNIKFFVVYSGSMKPAIKTGSIILVKPSPDYKINDIITFGSLSGESPPKTHRVVDIKFDSSETLFRTKGDANDGPDRGFVKKDEVIGKVFLSIPYLGYLVAGARTKFGLLAIVLIPALVIIFSQVPVLIREIKRIRNVSNKN